MFCLIGDNQPVFGTPPETGGIDEIRSGKDAQPVSDKVERGSDAVGVSPEMVLWVFATQEPGVGC